MGLIDRLFRRNKETDPKTITIHANDPRHSDLLQMVGAEMKPSRPSPQRAHAKHRKSRNKMARNSRKKNRR